MSNLRIIFQSTRKEMKNIKPYLTSSKKQHFLPNNYSKSSPTAIIFYTILNYVPRFGPKKSSDIYIFEKLLL
jgi:hypothetical protein